MAIWISNEPEQPAEGGGEPMFPQRLPFVKPTIPNAKAVAREVEAILESGILTNGPRVKELERRAADYLGVRHCVAVASCTSGLMLLMRAAELTGDVVLPSFTFVATAHAVAWNGLRTVFADVDPKTLTLSSSAALKASGVRTSALLGTHTFGTPCDVHALAAAARVCGVRLFFDAAHAFGSRVGARMVGSFGDAEVFSLTPTKILVAGEGGLITTNDDVLAERCRIGRDYANPGDYDSRFVGLNARMSEMHAALALASFEGIDERIELRNELAAQYRRALEQIPGIGFPEVPEGSRSTFKDFTIIVGGAFGLDAASLGRALAAEGIETRRYYTPPVHAQRAYRSRAVTNGGLPVTDSMSARVITLPLWGAIGERQIALVAAAVDRIGTFYRARSRAMTAVD